MNGSSSRPAIPEAIAREVRQRCRFGCVMCGMPFFDYEHMTEFAYVREHTADNITLLCPNHHAKKTRGKLDVDRIRAADQEPFNAKRERSSEYDIESSRELRMVFGTNSIGTIFAEDRSVIHAVQVNGRSFMSVHREDGWFTYSVIVTDAAGRVLLVVRQGKLVMSTAVWDYTYEGSNLQIRAGKGHILLDACLTNHEIDIRRGAFIDVRDRTGFLASPEGLDNLIGGQPFGRSAHCGAYNFGGAGWVISNKATLPWNVLEYTAR